VCGVCRGPARLPFRRRPPGARPGQPGAARFARRNRPDAAHRLRRADLARPRGIARRRGLHDRDPVQGARRAVLADAARGGARRRRARGDLRAAEPAPARPVPRRLDAGAAFHRDLRRRRVRDQARLLDRHHRRSAAARRLGAGRAARLVFRAARRRRGDAALRGEPFALEDRARLARDPRPRGGGRRARHQRTPRQAVRVRRLLHHHGDRGVPVRLLPRIRVGRGVLALPDDRIRGDGDHRRHGLAPRRAARHGVRSALSLRHRRRDEPARARRAALVGGVRGELLRLRAGDDPVPRLRAAGPGGPVAARAGLVPALAVQATPAGRR